MFLISSVTAFFSSPYHYTIQEKRQTMNDPTASVLYRVRPAAQAPSTNSHQQEFVRSGSASPDMVPHTPANSKSLTAAYCRFCLTHVTGTHDGIC